eukprot:2063558-Pleurochrysis_carterae.AAC.1
MEVATGQRGKKARKREGVEARGRDAKGEHCNRSTMCTLMHTQALKQARRASMHMCAYECAQAACLHTPQLCTHECTGRRSAQRTAHASAHT